ncbi:hypothetical protein [Nonomuraea salmonea]|uniref:hypothetical protein n=1 Tax=Nonomuraea salmonea TaxID=46181 RepID=UPI002FE912F5
MRFAEELGTSHGRRLRRGVLDDGRAVFVKSGPASEVLVSEAAGLRWLGEVAAVPEVIEAEPDRLVLAWVREERPDRAAAERFGRMLARMHRAGGRAVRGSVARVHRGVADGQRGRP